MSMENTAFSTNTFLKPILNRFSVEGGRRCLSARTRMTRISTGEDEKVGFFVCPSLKNLLGNEEVGIERSGELFESVKLVRGQKLRRVWK